MVGPLQGDGRKIGEAGGRWWGRKGGREKWWGKIMVKNGNGERGEREVVGRWWENSGGGGIWWRMVIGNEVRGRL